LRPTTSPASVEPNRGAAPRRGALPRLCGSIQADDTIGRSLPEHFGQKNGTVRRRAATNIVAGIYEHDRQLIRSERLAHGRGRVRQALNEAVPYLPKSIAQPLGFPMRPVGIAVSHN